MSKYIIDIPNGIEWGVVTCRTEDGFYTRDFDSLEELNSDYINEHYGSLQDEAYQRGYEDGKKSIDLGCKDCKYHEDTSLTNPCSECTRAWKDHYTPAPHSDRIEVGDEVKAPRGKAIVTAVKDDLVHYFYSEGDFGCVESYHVTKTGKHYDIQSILEAMRNDR